MKNFPFEKIDLVIKAFGLDDEPNLSFVDSELLDMSHTPPFKVDSPVVLYNCIGRHEKMKTVLMSIYPLEHKIKIIHKSAISLFDLADLSQATNAEFVFIPPLEIGSSFESFQEIIAHLRAPDGCPWDKEQTHLTLRKHLLEETYEAIEAIDFVDPAKMQEEFGDILLQVVLNSQIANEFGEFRISDVVKGIYDKMIRRHPHVFGEVKIENVGGVLKNWEKLKAVERKMKGEYSGILDGVSKTLPALTQAQEYQDRAARVGFDWNQIDDVLNKIREEISEVQNAKNKIDLAEEIGDLFFVLVNFARWKNIEAESALRESNQKFKRRFGYIEQQAKINNKLMQDMSLDEMDSFWNEAKKLENKN